MDREKYRNVACAMIYLSSCAVNGTKPDAAKIQDIDTESLFRVCKNHNMTAVTAYALEAAGIRDHEFTQAKEKAIRKNILLDTERMKILKRLEAEHIWYMPMKGVLLKEWYPKLGMRQMSDNDILCDENYRSRIREIMLEEGFVVKGNTENVDKYTKKPVYNFEMHSRLFTEYNREKIYHYYVSIKDKLIKDAHNDYGYHFSHEDFYIYMTAHEYKHYMGGGTGIRSLLDIYIFMKENGDTINMNYIEAELAKMGISQFEQQNRALALRVFSLQGLTDEENALLDYYIFSGTYGNYMNAVKNSVEKGVQNNGKIRYILRRVFPPMGFIKMAYPFFYRHKWLIPVLWIFRPFRGLIVRRKKIMAEIKLLFSYK